MRVSSAPMPSHSSYVPTALPSGKPSVPPTSVPSSTPTSPWPTPAATNFTGFNYRSTLTCVTGPLPANATYVNGVSARPRVRTRLRTGTTLVVRAGTSGTGSGFVATQSEAGCRFRDSLWAPASSSSYRIFFGFYNAKTRSLEDYYETGNGLTATKSAAVVKGWALKAVATFPAVALSGSKTTARSNSRISDMTRAWLRPMTPTPATPARRGVCSCEGFMAQPLKEATAAMTLSWVASSRSECIGRLMTISIRRSVTGRPCGPRGYIS